MAIRVTRTAEPPAPATQATTQPVQAAAAGRLAGIDALRGVGALMVCFFHTWHHYFTPMAQSGRHLWIAYPALQGFVGVNLFLVVSGFCIHARAARKDPNRNPEFAAFWRRRLRRLYPPYLAAVGVTVILLALTAAFRAWKAQGTLSGQAMWHGMAPGGAGQFGWAAVVHVFMLFPFWPAALDLFHNWPFWTLALEEHLYLMYFAVPWLRRRLGMEKLVLVSLGVTLVWRVLVIFGPLGHPLPGGLGQQQLPELGSTHAVAWMRMGPARWFEWILGAVAVERAFGHVRDRRLYTSMLLALAAAAAAFAAQWSQLGQVFTDPLWGVCFFIVVNRGVDAERDGRFQRWWWARPLTFAGLFSYSIYLIHQPLLAAIQYPLLKALPTLPALVLAVPLAVAIAWIFYRAFELPAIRWAKKQ